MGTYTYVRTRYEKTIIPIIPTGRNFGLAEWINKTSRNLFKPSINCQKLWTVKILHGPSPQTFSYSGIESERKTNGRTDGRTDGRTATSRVPLVRAPLFLFFFSIRYFASSDIAYVETSLYSLTKSCRYLRKRLGLKRSGKKEQW